MEDSADLNGSSRWLPEAPLPPYSYVPGVNEHPISSPNGHGVVFRETTFISLSDESWCECQPYLYGLDLFDAGFYWEAHETWEHAWIDVGRRGMTADFLKGLIKLCAAGVKFRERKSTGVERHLARCRELLGGIRQQWEKATFCGVRLGELDHLLEGPFAPVDVEFRFPFRIPVAQE